MLEHQKFYLISNSLVQVNFNSLNSATQIKRNMMKKITAINQNSYESYSIDLTNYFGAPTANEKIFTELESTNWIQTYEASPRSENSTISEESSSGSENSPSRSEQVTVKETEGKVILRPDSPTQARDFKLYCEGCLRCFTSRKRLQNHVVKCIKKINAENPAAFPCRKCSKFFKKRSGLVRHSMKYHDISISFEDDESSEDIEMMENREESQAKRSIFHSVALLAVSDSPMRR